jgi:hypothetical protein
MSITCKTVSAASHWFASPTALVTALADEGEKSVATKILLIGFPGGFREADSSLGCASLYSWFAIDWPLSSSTHAGLTSQPSGGSRKAAGA